MRTKAIADVKMPARQGNVLKIAEVVKHYGAVKALDGISFSINSGEIIGLIGANGAGKSTLMRVLAGATTPDAGKIFIDNEEAQIGNPKNALESGIALVSQELHLVDSMTVAENMSLGRMPNRFGLLSQKKMIAESISILHRLGGAEKISPVSLVGDLSPVEQRLITIARALLWKPRFLILDEPSASLPTDTAEALMPIIQGLAADGLGIFYVSHRLNEIRQIATRVVAMRNGLVVSELQSSDASIEAMVHLIGGKEQRPLVTPVKAFENEPPVLTAAGLCGVRIQDVNLDVYPGEIVGVSGLQGSGRSELLRLLTGVQKSTGGAIDIFSLGPARSIEDAAHRGVGYLAEGRRFMALTGMSVLSNLTISTLSSLSRFHMYIDTRIERSASADIFKRLQIAGQLNEDIQTLSGGNQQKIFIGRWLLRNPKLLILDEPTMGIDVGARA